MLAVAIEQQDPITLCLADAALDGSAVAKTNRMGHDLRIAIPGKLSSVISRTIVDDDHLTEWQVEFAEHFVELIKKARHVETLVARRHDDRQAFDARRIARVHQQRCQHLRLSAFRNNASRL